ncbi:MAG TPA: hypothetical protein VHK69_12700 [Chitinophagaceae bacterium]|jgi:hypothetical protein|nr:hypothetical protein [Chitinophagaceae bacterium]
MKQTDWKHYLALAIAALLLGGLAFAAVYYVFGWPLPESTSLGSSVALSGFVIECLRPAINAWARGKAK